MEAARGKARKEYDEFMRRDLTENVYVEIERARKEARDEYEARINRLEYDLEDTHVKQLQTLQDVREKNKERNDELKQKHQEEMENLEKSYEEKIKAMKDILQDFGQADINALEVNHEKDLNKLKDEFKEIHSKVGNKSILVFFLTYLWHKRVVSIF